MNASKLIVVIILFSMVIKIHVLFSVLDSLMSYAIDGKFLPSLFLLVSVTPWFMTLVGCIAILRSQAFGFLLVYLAFPLSLLGYSWLYLPFISLPTQSFFAIVMTLVSVNGVVLLLLEWSRRRQMKKEKQPHESSRY